MKMITITDAEAKTNEFCEDIIHWYYDITNNGQFAEIVEATAQELANMGAQTACGKLPNKAYRSIAARFPDLLIRTCLYRDKERNFITSSCDILIDNEKQAKQISSLAGAGGGSLRSDFIVGRRWQYFETE